MDSINEKAITITITITLHYNCQIYHNVHCSRSGEQKETFHNLCDSIVIVEVVTVSTELADSRDIHCLYRTSCQWIVNIFTVSTELADSRDSE